MLRPEWIDLPIVCQRSDDEQGEAGDGAIDMTQAHQEQRRRAREMARALGFRGVVSDPHAARIVAVLSRYVPGLRCLALGDLGELPDVNWQMSRAGRPSNVSPSDAEFLRLGVARYKDREARAGKTASDREALMDLLAKWKSGELGQGKPAPALRTLQSRLRAARRNYEMSLDAWDAPIEPGRD